MLRFLCSLSIVILMSFQSFAAKIDCTQKHCLAVVDAGSSGSRLHVYSFDFDKSNSPVNIHEEFVQKKSPGLSSIRSDVTTVNAYMDELFKGVQGEKIPVYFYATAGMRLVSSPEQKIYYQNISEWFKQHPEWNLLAAKTIAGNEEGLFGWLAINKVLGRFENNEGYVGFMDMGGASVQIATVVNQENNIQDQDNDLVKVNIYGRDIKLFVHSFLGLGQTEVNRQSLDKKECYSDGYEMPNNIFGKGDVYLCEEQMETIINDVHKVKDIVQPVLANAPETQWYTSGGVVYTVTDKVFQFADNKFTNQSFLDKAQNVVCQQSWDNLIAANPKNAFLYGFCQFAAYDYALMVKGYGFDPNQEIHYLSSELNFDWTMGVVLTYKHKMELS